MKTLIFLSLLCLSGRALQAQTSPRLLPFQGRLTDQSGAAISNGARLIQFKIFDVPTGGSPIWPGELHRTTVNGGLVNVLLGSKASFAGINFDRQLYLEITADINGDNAITAVDPPMLPRQVILPTLFAQESRNSAKLLDADWSAILANNSSNPVTGMIDGRKVANGTISSAQIAPQAIEMENLGSSVVQQFTQIQSLLTNVQSLVTSVQDSLNACCTNVIVRLQELKDQQLAIWDAVRPRTRTLKVNTSPTITGNAANGVFATAFTMDGARTLRGITLKGVVANSANTFTLRLTVDGNSSSFGGLITRNPSIPDNQYHITYSIGGWDLTNSPPTFTAPSFAIDQDAGTVSDFSVNVTNNVRIELRSDTNPDGRNGFYVVTAYEESL